MPSEFFVDTCPLPLHFGWAIKAPNLPFPSSQPPWQVAKLANKLKMINMGLKLNLQVSKAPKERCLHAVYMIYRPKTQRYKFKRSEIQEKGINVQIVEEIRLIYNLKMTIYSVILLVYTTCSTKKKRADLAQICIRRIFIVRLRTRLGPKIHQIWDLAKSPNLNLILPLLLFIYLLFVLTNPFYVN
ncbi:hypothetical protein R3W88_026569 [Solanum pinnatisectum]|uniref:Uncharacterized protein n=1 Tax=Solanum pinnatisectum TaxID=50273 RepID=A0AAV9LDM2_9SOLN|nr:hypothetical protein R3W88_026569 [Solanum pinnatisectum]